MVPAGDLAEPVKCHSALRVLTRGTCTRSNRDRNEGSSLPIFIVMVGNIKQWKLLQWKYVFTLFQCGGSSSSRSLIHRPPKSIGKTPIDFGRA